MDANIQLDKIKEKIYSNLDKLLELSQEFNVSYIIWSQSIHLFLMNKWYNKHNF